MAGRVVQIFISPTKGEAMQEVAEVYASKESGLEGDRYGKGEGSWSTPGTTHRQVSLIAAEAIEAANEELVTQYSADRTRRNIVTSGVDLNSLVDREFSIGQARLRGTKLCTPCTRPPELAGKNIMQQALFKNAFQDRGGLCAEVVIDGLIRANDQIIYE